jgi:hypothetical protein
VGIEIGPIRLELLQTCIDVVKAVSITGSTGTGGLEREFSESS